MSQNSLVLPTTGTVSGLQMTQYTNQALDTLNTLASGASAPGSPEAGQWWHDTTNNTLYIRNLANSAWIPLGALDETNDFWLPPIGGGVATIASASTVDLGSVPQSNITISGTTPVTSFGTSMIPGQNKVVTFSGVLTLTYNATSLILPGAANITTAAGDKAIISCLASGNYSVIYQRATGQAVVSSGAIGIQSSFKNLSAAWASNTTVSVLADQVLLQNGSAQLFKASSVNVTLNSATSGANGLDTGSLAANTWYYVYLIYNGTTVSSLMSLSVNSPILPGGYTYLTGAISAVLTDVSKNFIGFQQFGRYYSFTVGNNLSGLPILASGSSGNISTPTWTSVSLTSWVPGISSGFSTRVIGTLSGAAATGANAMLAPNNSYGAIGNTSNLPPCAVDDTASATGSSCSYNFGIESNNIYYASNGSTYVQLASFVINI